MVKIFLGADHNGYHLKSRLKTLLDQAGYDLVDSGDERLDPDDDFPVFAGKVVIEVLGSNNPDPRGILLCGSGQGMCMAANRYKGIRASLCWDTQSARDARNDDNANVLCLPAKQLNEIEAFDIVDTWLKTPFANAPRFNRRLKELDEL